MLMNFLNTALVVTICTLEALGVACQEQDAENHIGVLWIKLKTHATFLFYLCSSIAGWALVCICHFLQLHMKIANNFYHMHKATTRGVTDPQLQSSSSSFYGIPSLSLFRKYLPATTTVFWSLLLRFQNRKQWFRYEVCFDLFCFVFL